MSKTPDPAVSLLLVQPWFLAPGHPAQSLLHAARALGPHRRIGFLLPAKAAATAPDIVTELTAFGIVLTYTGGIGGFPVSTAAALFRVKALRAQGIFASVLLFDAHLPVLLGLAALGYLDDLPVAAVMLQGPERTFRSALRRQLLRRALRRSQLKLHCRTDELTSAWNARLGPHRARVTTLPSLELPRVESEARRGHDGPLRLGILGQIRRGKGIERMAAALDTLTGIELSIAGPYASTAARRRYQRLVRATGSEGRVLSERELVEAVRCQDYVLLLYDAWDDRMESGIFYLAAAVGRPVVTYRGGWCGRQIETYGCGVVVERTGDLVELEALPRPGSVEYLRLCEGMSRFARDHQGEHLAASFLAALGAG